MLCGPDSYILSALPQWMHHGTSGSVVDTTAIKDMCEYASATLEARRIIKAVDVGVLPPINRLRGIAKANRGADPPAYLRSIIDRERTRTLHERAETLVPLLRERKTEDVLSGAQVQDRDALERLIKGVCGEGE